MKNSFFYSTRTIYFIGFILIAALLSIAIYLQKQDGITPCPLCVLQRMTLALLGVIFFIGATSDFKKAGQLFIGIFSFLTVSAGIVLAGRQVFLQYQPPANLGEECGMSLSYLFQVLPWTEALKKIFAGGAECAQVMWQFLHLSLAEWALIWFVIFLFLTVFQLARQK